MSQLSIQRAKKLKFLMPQISALGSYHFSTAAQTSSTKPNAPRVPNLIGGRFPVSLSAVPLVSTVADDAF
ncbi:hypothetical protein P8452_33284 [Trifolium repens]|nr:hypothetical protein P8452_33284 [Trifolium repens]